MAYFIISLWVFWDRMWPAGKGRDNAWHHRSIVVCSKQTYQPSGVNYYQTRPDRTVFYPSISLFTTISNCSNDPSSNWNRYLSQSKQIWVSSTCNMATNEELLKTVFFLRNYEILLMKMAFPLNKFQSTRTIAVLLLYHCITIFFLKQKSCPWTTRYHHRPNWTHRLCSRIWIPLRWKLDSSSILNCTSTSRGESRPREECVWRSTSVIVNSALSREYIQDAEQHLLDFSLALINNVHVLYQQPTLSPNLEIVIVRYEMWKSQPVSTESMLRVRQPP